ncbi:hypothetical protein [Glycomyces sp. YM15]|uniref:hypothetical protein n=1 Tax=Glycomyces sp. YM15 TaxID=2800446 RepID=UPI001964995E|nr:hypothetical protein [Glycomyces sp. YM15]
MAANERLVLSPLPKKISTHPETFEAARRLEGAHESVQGHLDTLHSVRDRKIKNNVNIRRLDHKEVDLLRAAIVFAGAGLDAVLKQLISDTLLRLVGISKDARKLLGSYGSKLVDEEPGVAKRVLASSDRNTEIMHHYLENLTKGSLQSTSELKRVRDALGLSAVAHLSDQQLDTFDDFFLARNQIVHELDLKKPSGPGDFTRRNRAMSTSRTQADEALQLALVFIQEVDALLDATNSAMDHYLQ